MHRDIKPQNCILSEQDQKIKLIDFGAAADLRIGERAGYPWAGGYGAASCSGTVLPLRTRCLWLMGSCPACCGAPGRQQPRPQPVPARLRADVHSPLTSAGINYVPNQYLLDPRYAPPQQYIMSKQTPRWAACSCSNQGVPLLLLLPPPSLLPPPLRLLLLGVCKPRPCVCLRKQPRRPCKCSGLALCFSLPAIPQGAPAAGGRAAVARPLAPQRARPLRHVQVRLYVISVVSMVLWRCNVPGRFEMYKRVG